MGAGRFGTADLLLLYSRSSGGRDHHLHPASGPPARPQCWFRLAGPRAPRRPVCSDGTRTAERKTPPARTRNRHGADSGRQTPRPERRRDGTDQSPGCWPGGFCHSRRRGRGGPVLAGGLVRPLAEVDGTRGTGSTPRTQVEAGVEAGARISVRVTF